VTRVAKPLAVPQEAVPKWFLSGFISLDKMTFRKHGHVGVQIETKLGEVLSCIGKGCSAKCGLPDVLQVLLVQHRKEEIEKSYTPGRMKREKVEMALACSAILNLLVITNFCNGQPLTKQFSSTKNKTIKHYKIAC
jgi:hypothetical protein